MTLRLFTVEEANRLLPTLKSLLEALASKKAELVAKQAELAALLKAGQDPGDQTRYERLVRGREELKFIAEEFNVSLHTVSRTGALVKDVDAGLVDFAAMRNGREVLLCWRLGEPRVAHWHGMDEGFAGRKRLDDRPREAESWSQPEGSSDGAPGSGTGSPTYH
jgi:hypothetical protein